MADSPANGALQVVRQLKELWTKQPKPRRMLAVLVLVGVVGFVGITSLAKHVETWSVAIEGISPDDANELYGALIARNVPARIVAGKVEVHDDDLDQAHAIAASAGLPFSGKGFELFDGNNLGQSSFAEQVNYRRALQGELARSITTLAQVESARVHLAIGKRSVFKDQEQQPTASVALHLHSGQQLTAEQVRGVRQLVAASLEGLKPEAVAIVDNHGNLLDGAEPGAKDQQQSIEHTVADRVRMILERVVGVGHVSVVANADVDTRKVSETEDLYDKDSAAVRSESRTVEGNDSGSTTSGVAGARGNLPGAPAPSGGSGAPANGRTQETRNFEISHKVRQTTEPEHTLKKLHVAVLVDQTKGPDGKPVVRTKQQMDELIALAREAAGIDDARGDVLEVRSMTFAPDEDVMGAAGADAPGSKLPLPMPVMIGAGAGALVLLVVMALMVKKLRRRGGAGSDRADHIAFPTPLVDLERALETRARIEAAQLAAGKVAAREPLGLPDPNKSHQDRVMDAVRLDVERAAGVLTAWLAETPPKGAKA